MIKPTFCVTSVRNKKKRSELIDIYKILLLKPSRLPYIANKLKAEQLKQIYRKIRAVAMIALDLRNTHLPVELDILSSVLSLDFYENRYKLRDIHSILNPLLELLNDEVYLSINSQTIQRSYEIAAAEWLKINKAFDSIIEQAVKSGLSDVQQHKLQHFARYELRSPKESTQAYLNEYRKVQTVKRQSPNVEASFDINPLSKCKYVDFYIYKEKFCLRELPMFLFNICSLIRDQIVSVVVDKNPLVFGLIDRFKTISREKGLPEDVVNEMVKEAYKPASESLYKSMKEFILPSYKEVLWSVIRFFINDRYYFDIDHHIKSDYDYFSLKLHDAPINLLPSNLTTAVASELDPDRCHELKHLQKAALKRFDGFVMICLSRIVIYDYSKPPKDRVVTDIDSVILKVSKNEFILEFNETKNTRQAVKDASKNLREKFIKILKPNTGYRIEPVIKYGAKVRIRYATAK